MTTRGRRFRRVGPGGSWTPGTETSGDVLGARALAGQHLLLVPTTVSPEQVAILLRDRIPAADLLATGEVQLGRYSRFSGPYELSMEDAVDAAVPMPWTLAYALATPTEREDPPPPDLDDRDGFAFSFPAGMPWREEGRGLHLLVALARRLDGAVRAAGSHELITPDPQRAVDFLIHAPYWVEPEVLLGVVGRELPTARLAIEGQDWAGPSDAVYSGEAIAADTAHDPLTAAELDALHVAADFADMEALSGQDVIDGYAIVGELPRGVGAVEVLVHVAEGVEPSVADEPWSRGPYVTHEIRWACPDPVQRERRLPTEAHLVAREAARPIIGRVARAVVEATSGVVVDEDGFRYDRYLL